MSTYAAEDYNLSTRDCARRSGYSETSLRRFRDELDCPAAWADPATGEVRWNRCALDGWVAARQRAGSKIGTGNGRAAGPPGQLVRALPGALLERIHAIQGLAEMPGLAKDVLAFALEGGGSGQANAAVKALGMLERVLSAQESRASAPEVLVSSDAAEVARIFDGIVDGVTRRELLDTIRRAAEEDAAAYDPEDPAAARARLEARGLDAFGEPQEADDGEQAGGLEAQAEEGDSFGRTQAPKSAERPGHGVPGVRVPAGGGVQRAHGAIPRGPGGAGAPAPARGVEDGRRGRAPARPAGKG